MELIFWASCNSTDARRRFHTPMPSKTTKNSIQSAISIGCLFFMGSATITPVTHAMIIVILAKMRRRLMAVLDITPGWPSSTAARAWSSCDSTFEQFEGLDRISFMGSGFSQCQGRFTKPRSVDAIVSNINSTLIALYVC